MRLSTSSSRASLSPSQFFLSDHGAVAIIVGLGVVLSSVILFDVYQDWIWEGNPLWTTVLENLVPFLIAMGIAGFGWWYGTWEEPSSSLEVVKWMLAGTVGTALVCTIVLGFQVVQGQLKPVVILTQLTTVGAAAGLLTGQVVGWMKGTRRQLRRHRDLLRRTQEVAKIGGWEYDPSTDTVKGTDQFNEILGLPEGEDFTLERAVQFYPTDRRDTVQRNVQRCLEQGTPFELELPLIRKDDQRRWVRVCGERQVREDEAYLLIGTLQDITEQKEVEQTLREEKEVLRKMYRTTADRKKSFDAKIKKLIDLGRSYLDLSYGYVTRVSEDTLEITHATGGHTKIKAGHSLPLSQAYCRKTMEEGLLAVQNAPEEGWKGDSASEMFGLNTYIGSRIQVGGDLYGTFCFAAANPRERPFSERQQTFVELLTLWASYEIGQRRATRRLKEQNQRLDRFASVVSHDLRNPLNVAMGRLRIAQEALPMVDDPEGQRASDPAEEEGAFSDNRIFQISDPSEVVEHMEAAGQALERMNEIIEDMLALTWGRREADSDEIESVDIRQAAERCWPGVDRPGASLVVGASGEIEAHEGRLQQLLENLFRNALEHGGDEVTVTVGILSEEAGGEGFFVEDDGPGIPEEKREKVLETGYTTSEEGTGLGLPIARSVVDSHGWDLSVTEGQNGGARFEIRGVRTQK